MKKQLATRPKLDDDGSDALSTATNNSGHRSGGGEEHSPSMLQNLGSEEMDTLCDGSKKIRKKRNAYQKIDDTIRLKLLEAVKHGETLKSAAKKYKINYSSAKSILHTYRKEGRILKKSAQERNIKRNPGQGSEMEATPSHEFENEELEKTHDFNAPIKAPHVADDCKMEVISSNKQEIKAETPNNGQSLVENLVNLLKGSMKGTEKTQPQTIKIPTKIISKMANEEEDKKGQPGAETVTRTSIRNGEPTNLADLTNFSQLLQENSLEKFRALDGFFASFSGSSLGATANKMKSEPKDSLENQKEKVSQDLGTLGETMSALQSQLKKADEICVPHPVRFNTAQLLQEKIESKMNSKEEEDWDQTIENAALDTFKSFMDAQLLLFDALKKASYLNTLMQVQKARGEVSPQAQDLKN